MNFIDRLEELRKEKGITRKQLLKDCTLGKNQITYWEKKGTIPTPSVVSTLAKYFGVTADYLLGKTDNPVPLSEQIKEFLPYEKRGVRPIIGLTSAGTGVIAEEMIIGWETVDDEYDNEDCFWLKISGDSMSPKIDDEDLVLIQRDAEIESGNIAVVVVDEIGFIKQVELNEDSITLHSFNPYYPDMVFKGPETKRIRFIGKARKVERDL